MSVTVREVLGLAAAHAGRGDLESVLSDAGNADTVELLRCYNVVENEVALDFYPVSRTQTFTPEKGIVPVTAFERQPVNVLRVTDGKGRRLPFSTAAEFVRTESGGEVEIEYTYAPEKKKVGENSEFGDKISARLLSYGVASVYLLSRGSAAEAAEWERRYREALRAAGICRRTLSVRSRRWA